MLPFEDRRGRIPGGRPRSNPLAVLLLGALIPLLPPVGGAPHAQDLAAQEPVPVEGRVLGADSRRPVSGARVELVGQDRTAITDVEGTFRLDVPEAGSYELRVEALGYRPTNEEVRVGPRGGWVDVTLLERPLGLDEVVATGTPLRGATPVQPSQAYRTEDLELRAANSFGEMLDGEPGLAMRSFGPVAGRPVIRGLDGDRVAVLEGGQRMGDLSETAHDHAVAMEPLLAERVEVIRGPSSLLYGSNALGGVVNLLRRNVPTGWGPGLSGRANAQGASVNRLAAGAGTATYGSDRWALTGRASVRDGGDFRAPGTPDGVLEGTHNRLVTAGAGLGWQGERRRGGIGGDLYDHVYGIPEELDDPDEEVEIRSERQRLTGELDWQDLSGFFQDVEVRVSGSRFFQQEVEMDRSGEAGWSEEIEHEFERFAADASVTAVHGPMGPVEEGAVGVSLLASRLAATGEAEFHPDGRDLAAAVFAFQRIPVARGLDLQAGLRLEHDRTEASENELFPGFSAHRGATTFSGAVGLHARPSRGLEVGAQLARAHSSPMLEQLYSDGPHLGAGRYEVGDAELANEVGHGIDLFARYGTPRVQVDGALFVNRIDDFVFPSRTGEVDEASELPIVHWTATGARFLGAEVSLEAAAIRHLHLRITGDYVRATQRDEAGTPLPFIPPARASLGMVYDRGDWWLGGTGRAAATQDRVPESQEPTDGHALLDLHGGLRLGEDRDHGVILRLDNAFDAVYRDHLSRVDERRFPMPGRNLSLVYRWSF